MKVRLSNNVHRCSAMKTSRYLLPTDQGRVTRLMWTIWLSCLKYLAWRSRYSRMWRREKCWTPWQSLEKTFCKWSEDSPASIVWLAGHLLQHYFPFSEREVDLSFVCILSHGSSTNTIVDINGEDVLVEEEIIKEFDNERCPQLTGKLA